MQCSWDCSGIPWTAQGYPLLLCTAQGYPLDCSGISSAHLLPCIRCVFVCFGGRLFMNLVLAPMRCCKDASLHSSIPRNDIATTHPRTPASGSVLARPYTLTPKHPCTDASQHPSTSFLHHSIPPLHSCNNAYLRIPGGIRLG